MKFFLLAILTLISSTASAFEYEQPLQDPAKEQTAQQLFTEIRCITCDGESLAGSNADFSIAMRALIREQLAAGQGRDEVVSYLTDRYGTQILQAPPKQGGAMLLWLTPVFLILLGGVVIWRRKK